MRSYEVLLPVRLCVAILSIPSVRADGPTLIGKAAEDGTLMSVWHKNFLGEFRPIDAVAFLKSRHFGCPSQQSSSYGEDVRPFVWRNICRRMEKIVRCRPSHWRAPYIVGPEHDSSKLLRHPPSSFLLVVQLSFKWEQAGSPV